MKEKQGCRLCKCLHSGIIPNQTKYSLPSLSVLPWKSSDSDWSLSRQILSWPELLFMVFSQSQTGVGKRGVIYREFYLSHKNLNPKVRWSTERVGSCQGWGVEYSTYNDKVVSGWVKWPPHLPTALFRSEWTKDHPAKRVSQGRWLIPSSSEKKAEEAKESLFERLVKNLKNVTRAQTGGHLLGKPG